MRTTTHEPAKKDDASKILGFGIHLSVASGNVFE